MGLFNFLDPVMNFLFGWLLNLDPFLGLAIITLFISFLIVVMYKYTTDQNVMKSLKDRMKKEQEAMKKLKDSPEKMLKKQKELMGIQMEFTKHSMKSTLYTFIPIIIIFGWLSAHFSYYPMLPGEDFNVTITFDKEAKGTMQLLVPDQLLLLSKSNLTIDGNKLSWKVKGTTIGTYPLTFSYNENQFFQKNVIYSNERGYVKNVIMKKSLFDYIYSSREDFIPQRLPIRIVEINYPSIKPFSFIGWGISWFWCYIILSIIFSLGLRKVMKVY